MGVMRRLFASRTSLQAERAETSRGRVGMETGATGGAGSERDLIKCHPNLYPPFPDDQLDQQTNMLQWIDCRSLPA